MKKLTCFKAYDIRGKLGEELNEDIAWRIGRAYGEFLKPKTIVLGGDVRLTSETLKLALAKGLQDAGVDVLDIGMSGTEEIYFDTNRINGVRSIAGKNNISRLHPGQKCVQHRFTAHMIVHIIRDAFPIFIPSNPNTPVIHTVISNRIVPCACKRHFPDRWGL